MLLSEIGLFADEQLHHISDHYPYAHIPYWVVMPDHIHAIVAIDRIDLKMMSQSERWKQSSVNQSMCGISRQRGRLSIIVSGFKRAVSHFANVQGLDFGWQSRYHDRIIRDVAEMDRTVDYINNNVRKWCDEHGCPL